MGNSSSVPPGNVALPIPVPPESSIVPSPVLTPPTSASVTSPAQEVIPPPTAKVENTNNPGTFEDLHKKCKEIFPQAFEGGKIVIGKGLSSHFQINHTLTLANPMSSGYRFGATYVGTKQYSPQESYPVLLGDVDPSGNLNANVIHAFLPNMVSRFVAQFQGDKCNTQFVTDYKGSSYTASLTVANPDLLNSSGLVVSQFLQRVTPSIDIGAECMFQKGGHIPGGQIAIMSLAGRLQGERWQLNTTLCPAGPGGGGLHASFHQKINDILQIGAEFETSVGMGESSATIGYQYDIASASVSFKGQIDTNLTVQATMEKKFESGVPFTFLLSAMGNPQKSDYKIGVGMMLG